MFQLRRIGLLFFILFISGCQLWVNKHAADQHFTDPKVITLCEAAVRGDTVEIDHLLSVGIDINTVGKAGLNPIYWLLVHNEESEAKKIGFRHLLKNDANVLQMYAPTSVPLLHVTAEYVDSDYLRMILEEQPDIDIDLERPGDFWSTPLLYAIVTDRYENIELLIKHGVNIEKKNHLGDTAIDLAGWHEAYILLQNGADYRGGPVNFASGEVDEQPFIIWRAENSRYWPSVGAKNGWIDYRQKVIEFLREKGVEVNPWMPEDEEYRYEDGVAVLYILEEDGKWIKFKGD